MSGGGGSESTSEQFSIVNTGLSKPGASQATAALLEGVAKGISNVLASQVKTTGGLSQLASQIDVDRGFLSPVSTTQFQALDSLRDLLGLERSTAGSAAISKAREAEARVKQFNIAAKREGVVLGKKDTPAPAPRGPDNSAAIAKIDSQIASLYQGSPLPPFKRFRSPAIAHLIDQLEAQKRTLVSQQAPPPPPTPTTTPAEPFNISDYGNVIGRSSNGGLIVKVDNDSFKGSDLGQGFLYETGEGTNQFTLQREVSSEVSDILGSPQTDPAVTQEEQFSQLAATPGFQFKAREGAERLRKSSATRGLLRSGALSKDLLEFGQNLATSAFQERASNLAGVLGITSQGTLQQASQGFTSGLTRQGLDATLGENLASLNLAAGIGSANNIVASNQMFDKFKTGQSSSSTSQGMNLGGVGQVVSTIGGGK